MSDMAGKSSCLELGIANEIALVKLQLQATEYSALAVLNKEYVTVERELRKLKSENSALAAQELLSTQLSNLDNLMANTKSLADTLKNHILKLEREAAALQLVQAHHIERSAQSPQ